MNYGTIETDTGNAISIATSTARMRKFSAVGRLAHLVVRDAWGRTDPAP